MARIEKVRLRDGSTHYKAIVRRKGARMKTKTCRTRAAAEKWSTKIENEILDGRALPTRQEERRTVRELVVRYKAEVLADCDARSRQRRGSHLDWWAERIGDRRLLEVSPATVDAQLQALARGDTPTERPASPATRNRYLATLRHAFSIAEKRWQWLRGNPLRGLAAREPRGRVRFLSDDERERLLTACRDSEDPRLYPLVVLALSTGARQGELLGLRWKDIDLQRGVAVLQETKNDDRRAVPIHGEARLLLEQLSKVRRIDTDHVFVASDGRALYPRKAFLKALEAAVIEDFRFHDLRHSAASYLAMSGATLAEIADVLGHKTLAMVKRYSHLTEQHTSEVVRRMNARIFRAGG